MVLLVLVSGGLILFGLLSHGIGDISVTGFPPFSVFFMT